MSSRKITIGEVSYIVNALIEKSLVSKELFESNHFANSWIPSGGEVVDSGSTAVSIPIPATMLCARIIQIFH